MQYAGDITSLQAHELLSSSNHHVLVDVRTYAETNFVGAPYIEASRYLSCPLYELPHMEISLEFIPNLNKISRDIKLLFICRSGARSQEAAIIATTMGFKECYNIADGFEGPLDNNGHRGNISGWKASNLAWRQS